MKRYKRILAGVMFASLIASGISGSYGSIGGRLSLVNPVEAGERFSWGNPSGSNNQNEESSVEMNQEPERFQWRPDDETETVPEESASVEEDMQEDLYADSEGVLADESDLKANSSGTDESSLNTNKLVAEKVGSGQIIEQTVDVNLYTDERKQSVFEERNVKMTIEGQLPENCVIDAYPISFSMEDMEVIEAWNVTILDQNGEVYEPGKNPVQVTISSDAILNLPAGQIDIYHITDENEEKTAEPQKEEISSKNIFKWDNMSGTTSESGDTSEDTSESSENIDTDVSEDSIEDIDGSDFTVDAVADDGTPLTLEPLETIEVSGMENSITFEVKEFSGIAAVRGAEQLLGAGNATDVTDQIAIDTKDFLKINLFNYTNITGTNQGEGNEFLSYNSVKTGINLSNASDTNSLRDFRFYSHGIKRKIGEPYTINNYTGGHGTDEYSSVTGYQNYPVPMQGIVQNKLYDTNGQESPYGFPVLAYGAAYNDHGNWRMTRYNAYNSQVSLSYLFTDNQSGINGRTGTYTGLNKLFYINEDGMYEYDSKKYYAYYNKNQEDNGDFVLYQANSASDLKGFFPFDDFKISDVGPTVNNAYEHHFGMTMTADFFISQDGLVPKLDGQGNVILNGDNSIEKTVERFTFTGDDDLWVFVDGVLVLDVGGVHQPIDGTIDFKAGTVTVNDYCWKNNTSASDSHKKQNAVAKVGDYEVSVAEKLYLKDLLGDDWNNPYKKHTIKMFYIERGSHDSNLKLQFNMPSTKHINICKKVTGDDADTYKDQEFRFQLFLQDLQATEGEKYEVFNPHKIQENLNAISALNLGNSVSKVNGYHMNEYLNNLDISIGTENNGSIEYTLLSEEEIRQRFDEDGVFRLKHNEHIKIDNLIESQKYYVKELTEGDHFQMIANNIVDTYVTEAGLVSLNSAATFENRTLKRKVKVEKKWEDIPYEYQPDVVNICLKQKDYVRIHFNGSQFDSLAAPVLIPKGEAFSFELSIKEGQSISWDKISVKVNNRECSGINQNGVVTYTIPGTDTIKPVDVYVGVASDVTDYQGSTSYNKKLNTHPAEECVDLNPLEYVKLSIDVIGQVYNSDTQEYESVSIDELGKEYSVLKAGGDRLSITANNGIGFTSLLDTGYLLGTEQNLPENAENLKSSGNYSVKNLDGDVAITIELKGGQDTTIDDLKQSLALSMTDASNGPISYYSEPTGNVILKTFSMEKPEEGNPWVLNITDPSELGEQPDHYYKYEIDEISVKKGEVTMPLSEAGFKKTVTGPERTEEENAHIESFLVTNKFADVDITLIKTSSAKLPQGDETYAYEILPNVEFELYEKTIQTVTEGGEEVERVVLTPVRLGIVSNNGEDYEPGADPDAIAEAASKKGKIFLTDLKRGKIYFLKETQAAEGYYLPEDGWTITVGLDGKVTITGQDNYAVTYDVTTEGEFPGSYQIKNVKMYELPSTGGPGDYLFTIIGISISFAIVLLKLRELKEERAA